MSEKRENQNLPDAEIERLLRNCPSPEGLSARQRERIWDRLSAHLDELVLQRPTVPVRRRLVVCSAAAIAGSAGFALLLFMILRSASVYETQIGQVQVVHGRVIRRVGGSESKLTPGDLLNVGDRVIVAPSGGMRLRFGDGSKLWLGPGTELVLLAERSGNRATIAISRGEIRADITPSDREVFTIETPVATLRILGTQFHCQVMPPLERGGEAMERLRRTLRKAISAAVVVTVLSGSVAVETAEGEEVVLEAQRLVITAAGARAAAETVERVDYSRNWLGEPGAPVSPEALAVVTTREHMIQSLWAVDPYSGGARHVTDFVGISAKAVQRFGPDLALVKVHSVLFAYFGDGPISGAGRPFVNDQSVLVNLDTGEKIPMEPLRECDPLYMELSPNRRKLAFVGSREVGGNGDREYGVFVLDLETFRIEQLLEGAMKTSPHWSPDSRWLAISKATGYTTDHEIVLIDTVTGEVVDTGLRGAGVYFTPDGQRLVFSGGFKESGAWMRGVPMSGDLFLANVPDGEPEQITWISNGGAVSPSFSPDGSRLAYWEVVGRPLARLHIMNMASGEDRIVTEDDSLEAMSDLQWLDENSRFMLVPFRAEREAELKLIELTNGQAEVRSVTPTMPEVSPEHKAAADEMGDRLLEVFAMYREAADAQDLHRTGMAQAKYGETRDLLAAILKELESVEPETEALPLRLSPEDLKPYLEAIGKEADMTAEERSLKIVRDNLKYYIASLLRMYHKENDSFPGTPEELARFAQTHGWQINQIRWDDSARARRLFVVPGDDPEEVATSYRLVLSDEQQGMWVLQTPVLANGKRLEATYRLERKGTSVRVDAEVTEVP